MQKRPIHQIVTSPHILIATAIQIIPCIYHTAAGAVLFK